MLILEPKPGKSFKHYNITLLMFLAKVFKRSSRLEPYFNF